jgi:hypothetical protein
MAILWGWMMSVLGDRRSSLEGDSRFWIVSFSTLYIVDEIDRVARSECSRCSHCQPSGLFGRNLGRGWRCACESHGDNDRSGDHREVVLVRERL